LEGINDLVAFFILTARGRTHRRRAEGQLLRGDGNRNKRWQTIAPATRATIILVDFGSVITLFTRVYATISTPFDTTLAIATIARIRIGIVTFLNVVVHMSIAASGEHAALNAAVCIIGVLIIAGFKSILILLDIFTSEAITAFGWGARVGARIGIRPVAIITTLAILNCAITAASWLAIFAVIGGVIVAVIAAFTRS
jgi:hypothetical protein